jgi:peptidyl-prolyl cis-trans isomerase D
VASDSKQDGFMLNALRNSARSWVVKLLLLLLVLSFGVWGISGSLFDTGGDTVVRAGETEVSANEFRLAYDRQINQISQQLGTRLTTEQARAFGIEEQVYAQLVAGALLDQQSRDMRLGLSRDRLASLIAGDTAFQGIDGRFDRASFSAILRNAGLTEDQYIETRERFAVRAQVIEAVSDGFQAPQTLMDAVVRHQNETRTLDYLLLDDSIIDPAAPPQAAVLETHFNENLQRYRAPEYRRIAYVTLRAEDIADPAAIAPEAVRADYDRNPNRYATEERRSIQQLVFPNRESAEAAAQALEAGTSFEDVVAAQQRSIGDVTLGEFTRSTLPDANIAEAAFAISEPGGTSPVVDGTFGPVILRVTDIVPAAVETFEEVEDEIRQQLALVEANETLLSVYDSYEDARAGGLSLQEAAVQQRLDAVVIEAVDRSGRTPDGEIVADIPQSTSVLSGAFETDPGVETPALPIGSEGFIWFEVLDVIEERDRSLDEVRDEVVADWTAEQTETAIAARAAELRERLAGGEELSAIATEVGLAPETKYGLQRSSDDATFGPAAIAAAFAGGPGHVALAPGPSGATQILMQVTDIVSSGPTTAESLSQEERSAIAARGADDLLDQLVGRLETQYPVSINRSIATRALSF